MSLIELPYVANETLTGLAIAYNPTGLIGDKILTHTQVDTPEFKYRYYEKGQFLTTKDTEIGEYGEPIEEEFAYKEKLESISVYAHMTKLSVRHLHANTSEANKEAKRVMFSKNKLKLAGEVRLANLLRDKSIYEGNSLELTAQNNFSVSTTKVIKTIQGCKDKMYNRANTVVMSSRTLSQLRTCPQIVTSLKGKEVEDGMVSVEFLKNEVFGVDNILVGQGRVNTTKRGQNVNLSYIWGNDIILAYVDEAADIDCGLTFGQRAIYKPYSVQTFSDAKPGAEGVVHYKSVEEYKDFITCPDCGYIIKNAFTQD